MVLKIKRLFLFGKVNLKKLKKLKIFNDPIYGFIPIHNALIFNIIEHPYFQRLRRISQMGLSYLVYPGVRHTRFEHALGCLFLMQKTIEVLRFKKVKISKDESEALQLAILLHDIGHGPFSHTLEYSLVTGIQHEEISLKFMEQLNREFNGGLSLAIKIFKGEYERPFFNQLIASQLDIDRLDYLKRDSFYSGVTEGNINAERLITLLDVIDDNLVVDKKGIYSVEKFIVARRLMYWMVYLHKTSLAAEHVLVNILKRAQFLGRQDALKIDNEHLTYFIKTGISAEQFDSTSLDRFAKLDDIDILGAIKAWTRHPDMILSELSKTIIDRKLPKVRIQDEPLSKSVFEKRLKKVANHYGISIQDAGYFVHQGTVSNHAYDKDKYPINIKLKGSEMVDILGISDHLNLETLTNPVVKNYHYYPKN